MVINVFPDFFIVSLKNLAFFCFVYQFKTRIFSDQFHEVINNTPVSINLFIHIIGALLICISLGLISHNFNLRVVLRKILLNPMN